MSATTQASKAVRPFGQFNLACVSYRMSRYRQIVWPIASITWCMSYSVALILLPPPDNTGSPEILDGRVKTLHPKVHGGLLGVRG
jgi:hypothetical protein